MQTFHIPTYQGPRTNSFEVGPDERERITALRAQGILDPNPSECFDRIATLVSRVLECPLAIISFVDSERAWFKSNVGLENISEVHRNESMCSVAILPGAPDVTAVLDASRNETYRAHPVVTGPPFVRFYAGAPIRITHDGKLYKLGMVCVASKKPRARFDLRDKLFLLDMASVVADEIELFRGLSQRVMEENQRYITCTVHDLRTPVQVFRLSIELLKEYFKEKQTKETEIIGAAAPESAVEDSAHSMIPGTPSTVPFDLSPEGGVFSKKTHAKKQGRVVSGYFLAGIESMRTPSVEAAKLTNMLDVVRQAGGACDMMSETVTNAVDAAHARWTRVDQEEEGADCNGSRGFMSTCRSNKGDLGHQYVEMEVASLVKDCRRLSAWHHSDSVNWTEEIAPEVPSVIMADVTRSRRVLLNLITNACKHLASKAFCSSSPHTTSDKIGNDDTNSGQGHIFICVRLVSIEDDCSDGASADDTPEPLLRFEVHDNGDGVPSYLRSQLFVGAFVATPWTGECGTNPDPDPRSGDPDAVSELEERACFDNSAISEVTSYLEAAGSSKQGSLHDRTGLPVTDPGASASRLSVDQYLNDIGKHQGSGLGLFVANLCVQEMGGTTGFRCACDHEPKVNKSSGNAPAPTPLLEGSVFWFDIPFVPV